MARKQPKELTDFQPTRHGRWYSCWWGFHHFLEIPYTGAFKYRKFKCERCGKLRSRQQSFWRG